MEAKWIDEKQVAQLTGLAVQTLRNWRQQGRGFPYSKAGRAVRYAVTDVEEFMEARKVMIEET